MVKHVNSDHPSVVHPPHYLHELPQEDEERLENLFKSLDVDGNGKIDIHDLSVALREFGVNQAYAKVCCSCATLIRVMSRSVPFTYATFYSELSC